MRSSIVGSQWLVLNNGKLCRPMLPEYPDFFESELSRRPALYSSLLRRINALFAFSAIGTMYWSRVYHSILNLDRDSDHCAGFFMTTKVKVLRHRD